MVNPSPDDVDTMVGYQPFMQSEQGKEMHEHTPPSAKYILVTGSLQECVRGDGV